MKFRIYTEQGDYGRAMKLAVLVEGVNGVVQVAAPLKFEDAGEGFGRFDAPMTMDRDNTVVHTHTDGRGDLHRDVLDARALIQAFMDHGWEIGMRPTGVSDADTAKQVKAMDGHLQDMRALVFGTEHDALIDRFRKSEGLSS